MSMMVFGAVIFAALLHATWNALLKSGADKFASMAALTLGAVPLAALSLALAGLPAREAWPLVLASALIHAAYFLCLVAAYRAADFTQAYPIARGIAPVLTALAGAAFLGEVLSAMQSLAVLVIGTGVTSLVFAERGEKRMVGAGLFWALATGVLIATYSLVDGAGARLAGNSFSFYAAAALVKVPVMCLYLRVARPGALAGAFTRARPVLLLGAPISFVAYSLVTWDFTQAPIATVSALREVSIVFAVLIGTFILKERMNLRRIASTFVTLMGAMMIRFAR
ncbi:EamA family transporter [Aureimonas populi]|uniref:EamA family transporter n=1 Tax=Aureimonas populi TaxID=1701758 RepID=A0ABW5CLP5_9HYPH|nr:EamA family transporter [Aureimonas populi]